MVGPLIDLGRDGGLVLREETMRVKERRFVGEKSGRVEVGAGVEGKGEAFMRFVVVWRHFCRCGSHKFW